MSGEFSIKERLDYTDATLAVKGVSAHARLCAPLIVITSTTGKDLDAVLADESVTTPQFRRQIQAAVEYLKGRRPRR